MKIFVLILHLLGCALIVLGCLCNLSELFIMSIWLEALAIFFKLDIKQ